MTTRVDATAKILRLVFPDPRTDAEAIHALHRYARDPAFRPAADEVLRHAGLVEIARRVLIDGMGLEEAGRAVSDYASRVQAVAFACAQLAAAGRLMVWAAGPHAEALSMMAAAMRRIRQLEKDVALRDAALKARAAVPA